MKRGAFAPHCSFCSGRRALLCPIMGLKVGLGIVTCFCLEAPVLFSVLLFVLYHPGSAQCPPGLHLVPLVVPVEWQQARAGILTASLSWCLACE